MAARSWMDRYTPRELRKLRQKRDQYRNANCSGCRNNYYNFGKPQSSNGDVAVPEDYFCRSLPRARARGQQRPECYHV